MFKNKKAQVEKQNDLIMRAEAIVSAAENENRELTEAEAAELAEIRDDVKKIKEYLEVAEEIDAARPTAEAREEGRACGDEEAEKRALEKSDEEKFAAHIRAVVNSERAGELAKGENGAIIPVTVARRIIEHVFEVCPILARSDKWNIAGKLELPYYDRVTVTKDGTTPLTPITCAYHTEFVQLTSTTGKFANIELNGFLAGALCKISKSLVNNVDFDLVAFIVKEVGDAIARWLEGELLNGTDEKIEGLSGLTNLVTAEAADAVTGDELIDLQDSVPDVYQANAIWIMNTKTRTAIRKLKNEIGEYLLVTDLTSPFGRTLLGKPVYVSDNMPDMDANEVAIYYGDMSGLSVKFAEEIEIEVLRERFADEHAIGVIGWVEADAKVSNQQKIAGLKMAAS